MINGYSKPFFDYIKSNSLYLVPSDPTCHKSQNFTWLDIFITSCEEAVTEYNISNSPLYEHHDNSELKLKFIKPFQLQNALYLSYLSKINNSSALHCTLNDHYKLISYSINTALDSHALFKRIKIGTNRKPWFTPEIKNLMKLYNKLFKQTKSANSLALYNQYKKIRN